MAHRYMLRHRKMKHWMRTYYALTSLRRLKLSSLSSAGVLPEILRTAESTPVSKSIKVPTTSKVRTLKSRNDMACALFVV